MKAELQFQVEVHSNIWHEEVLPHTDFFSFFSQGNESTLWPQRTNKLVICSYLNTLFVSCLWEHRTAVDGESKYSEMGFGEDLWCPQAHSAVMRLLDSELHLMEVMKKWMGQRAKSEREFSVQLHHMTAIVEKLDRPQLGAGLDYISQLNKVRTPETSTDLLSFQWETATTQCTECDFSLFHICFFKIKMRFNIIKQKCFLYKEFMKQNVDLCSIQIRN